MQSNQPDTQCLLDLPVAELTPSPNTTRAHSPGQIRKLRGSIREFGFLQPVLIDESNVVIAGNARLAAALDLGMKTLPCVRITHLSDAERRAYAIADNKIAELGAWDGANLATELRFLADQELSFDLEVTGFETAELDFMILSEEDGMLDEGQFEDDLVPPPKIEPATKPGDLWLCGPHRVFCADAKDEAIYTKLMDGHSADMVFADPPYNLPISGHVRSKASGHREFDEACGEMTADEFAAFLEQVMSNMASASRDGALHYICMDWRHINEIMSTGTEIYGDLINLCVWNKTNGGMGSFYRSKHELVFVWKTGRKAHCNNVMLGQHGRYRTNVWDYAGVNSFGASRDKDLADHPTVKPTELVFDAILDCTKRGDRVLDPFLGSGTTMLAAERSGRIAFGIERDPGYVDVSLRRWSKMTGEAPVNAETGAKWQDPVPTTFGGSHD